VASDVTLADTNILLYLATADLVWAGWPERQLDLAAARGALLVNEVAYAELSVGFERMEETDAFLATAGIDLAPLPREALFLAGKVCIRCRARGGTRSGVLPDFFIGAHAAVSGLPLLTQDIARYRTWVSTLTLLAPPRL
jgi:predicted nucleic acid-binding protein